jgi:hypothetical protein
MMLMLLRGVLRLGSSNGKPPKTMTYSMMPIAHTSAVQASRMCDQRCSGQLWNSHGYYLRSLRPRQGRMQVRQCRRQQSSLGPIVLQSRAKPYVRWGEQVPTTHTVGGVHPPIGPDG